MPALPGECLECPGKRHWWEARRGSGFVPIQERWWWLFSWSRIPTKHSNSQKLLAHPKSSLLTPKSAYSWKEMISTPSAKQKVLPRLTLRSGKSVEDPNSESGSCCSQTRQECLELPSCSNSSVFPGWMRKALCDPPPVGRNSSFCIIKTRQSKESQLPKQNAGSEVPKGPSVDLTPRSPQAASQRRQRCPGPFLGAPHPRGGCAQEGDRRGHPGGRAELGWAHLAALLDVVPLRHNRWKCRAESAAGI